MRIPGYETTQKKRNTKKKKRSVFKGLKEYIVEEGEGDRGSTIRTPGVLNSSRWVLSWSLCVRVSCVRMLVVTYYRKTDTALD